MINIMCEEHLTHNSIIFKGNLCRCNLGIYLVNNSIIYIKFIDTATLPFNIGRKFYII